MSRYNTCVIIARPVHEVFNRFTDAPQWPEWIHRFEAVELTTDGGFRKGASLRAVTRLLGMKREWRSKVVEFVPNSTVSIAGGADGLTFEVLWTFEPEGDGRTRIQHLSSRRALGQGAAHWLRVMLLHLSSRMFDRLLLRDLDALKRHLETPAPS